MTPLLSDLLALLRSALLDALDLLSDAQKTVGVSLSFSDVFFLAILVLTVAPVLRKVRTSEWQRRWRWWPVRLEPLAERLGLRYDAALRRAVGQRGGFEVALWQDQEELPMASDELGRVRLRAAYAPARGLVVRVDLGGVLPRALRVRRTQTPFEVPRALRTGRSYLVYRPTELHDTGGALWDLEGVEVDGVDAASGALLEQPAFRDALVGLLLEHPYASVEAGGVLLAAGPFGSTPTDPPALLAAALAQARTLREALVEAPERRARRA
jgi:hypothetical protein